MKTVRSVPVGLALLGGLLMAASQAAASEPANNTGPFGDFSGDASVYQRDYRGSSGWGNFESISPSGDIDYLVMSCAASYKVTGVKIELNAGAGDLDIRAYNLDGGFLGSSCGVGSTEYINVSAYNQSAVVMAVYGYNSATGSYGIVVTCG
ncbi:MAG: hypothetical protein JW940_01095 [Polyangiaceae bacterium]|nr:hypothetical protein [Polyangiaceae bacterium]